ncbi:MAG: hypothetical protein AAGA85_09170 [Bacteroidota bacterium]
MTARHTYRVREGLLGNTTRAKVLFLTILFLMIGKLLFASANPALNVVGGSAHQVAKEISRSNASQTTTR